MSPEPTHMAHTANMAATVPTNEVWPAMRIIPSLLTLLGLILMDHTVITANMGRMVHTSERPRRRSRWLHWQHSEALDLSLMIRNAYDAH